jgi:hypothetical protein
MRCCDEKARAEHLFDLLVLHPVPPEPPDLGQRGHRKQRQIRVGPQLWQVGRLKGVYKLKMEVDLQSLFGLHVT